MTIIDFLKERVSEDESEATTPRALAECAAKRRTVEYLQALQFEQSRDSEAGTQYRAVNWVAQQLVKVYQDHPDYHRVA